MTKLEKAFIKLQHLAPQHGISRGVAKLAESNHPIVRTLTTQAFSKAYAITLDEYARKNLNEFDSFNDFFTRELEQGSRPIDDSESSIVCPADGVISQLGKIDTNRIFQAKGMDYSLERLLASNQDAKHFYDGQFATVYLAPSNYHRVHMPLTARLVKTRYVPGKLFSVNTLTAENVSNLFARNERMVCLFEVTKGPQSYHMAVILVGAMIVAGIETVVTGRVTPSKKITEMTHDKVLQKGEELGRFYLGSTAIVLLPQNMQVSMLDELQAGSTVQMGQSIANVTLNL